MRSRAIILGAGASHGHGVRGEPEPPLGTGFFQGPIADTVLEDYLDLTEYLRDTFQLTDLSGTDIEKLAEWVQGSWTLPIYEQQEIERRFGASFRAGGPPYMLRGYIVDHVWSATKWLARCSCPFHERLFRTTLSPGDTVIDFNYDLIADVTLKRLGFWDETVGYFERRPPWSRKVQSIVRLLKPHGSLNWFKDNDFWDRLPSIHVAALDDALRGARDRESSNRAFIGIIPRLGSALARDDDSRGFAEAAAVDPSFLLPLAILPASKKDFAELAFGELKNVWQQIQQTIEGASDLIAVGYSFRDPHFNQVLLEGLRQRIEPLNFVVVSPSKLGEPGSQVFQSPKLVHTFFRGTLEDYLSSPLLGAQSNERRPREMATKKETGTADN